jgi:hypothetical protein
LGRFLGEDLAESVDAGPPHGLELVEQAGRAANGVDVAGDELLAAVPALGH